MPEYLSVSDDIVCYFSKKRRDVEEDLTPSLVKETGKNYKIIFYKIFCKKEMNSVRKFLIFF